jgi:uncharacterized protein involved in outer membrane biogenesis
MPIRRRTRIMLLILLAVTVVGVAGFVYLLTIPPPLERWLQGRMLLALREHYQTDVQLENLHVTLIPELYATADNFVLSNRGRSDVPPLITVKHMTIRANLFELLRTPVRVSRVTLDGMVIKVAPKRDQPDKEASTKPKYHTHLANFEIDHVEAGGTLLYILRKNPQAEPMLFELRKLALNSAGVGQPMAFTAELTNPTPPGLIQTKGHFGPWNFDDPAATPVDGDYDFQHADLSVFAGISGILSSQGKYTGALNNIVVDGKTDVPNFQLDSGGQEVHLTTKFHAIVDGTNGNTYLQPVNAHFLNSNVTTNGEVAGKPGQKGKTITLAVDISKAYVQDVLALAAKGTPMLTGGIVLKATLVLPPEKQTVLQRMQLNGTFDLSNARFTQEKMKSVMDGLSRRGQGKPGDTSIEDVASDFRGDFDLRHSTITFTPLQFAMPGVAAQMKGSYGLTSGSLNFVGDVRLQATVSEAITGAKHVFLKPLDVLFKKNGAGTYLPVEVGGTREHPEVKLQWKKLF